MCNFTCPRLVSMIQNNKDGNLNNSPHCGHIAFLVSMIQNNKDGNRSVSVFS